MPYRTLHWVKLELRLLDDHRFFLMTEKAQLTFLKLLILCGKCQNKVPKMPSALRTLLRVSYTDQELLGVMDEIKKNFPKVLENNGFYKIKDFSEKVHWVAPKDYSGSSQGVAGELIDKIREDKIRIDKMYEPQKFFYTSYRQAFDKEYFANFGKDGKLFKALQKMFDVPRLKELITCFFASSDKFIKESDYSIGVFYSQINRLNKGVVRKGRQDE